MELKKFLGKFYYKGQLLEKGKTLKHTVVKYWLYEKEK